MPDLSVVDIRAARRARFAVNAVFVIHGILFASWSAHIPQAEAALGINDGQLGIGLLGEYVGRIYMESKRRPLFVVREVYRAAANSGADQSGPPPPHSPAASAPLAWVVSTAAGPHRLGRSVPPRA